MSYAVRILIPAEADTVEAALWYDAQASGLGADFLAEVNAAAERLAANPAMYAIRFGDVRRAPVHRFKFYGLFYLIRDSEVWVLAVFHGSRHPRWLMERRAELG
jgi:plasmid stabilization system protein ParE